MTLITFNADDEQPAARLVEACRRRDVLADVTARSLAAIEDAGPDFSAYADWYVSELLDGLLRRALVVEFREWVGHCEDLLRDQFSRRGVDPERWSDLRRGARGPELVTVVRRVLAEEFDAGLPASVWDGLEELAWVAETVGESTRAARQALQVRYPDYFSSLDAFGDGDEGGRLALRPEHAERAFGSVTAFWTPGRGLPYRVVGAVA